MSRYAEVRCEQRNVEQQGELATSGSEKSEQHTRFPCGRQTKAPPSAQSPSKLRLRSAASGELCRRLRDHERGLF